MQPSTSNSSLNLFAQQPLFWAATAYAAGIIASSVTWRPMSWWLAAAVVLLGSAIYLTPRRTGYAAALGLAGLGCLGALHYELSASTAPAAPDIARFTDGNEVVVTGHVIRTGLPRSQGATREPSTLEERREVIDIETEAIEGPAGRQEVTFGIRTTVRSKLEARGGANEASAFAYGERVRFPAKVREPRNYGNPGAMDYRGYLGGKGLSALASVGVEKFEKLQGSSGSSFGRWRHGVRQRVAQAMLAAARSDAGWWTLSHEDTTLLLAMVIGEQSLLERTTRTDFQKTGVFHVLVVSGMNVGMLALFVFWTARRLRMKQWLATALTIGSCLSYVMITDLGTPVLRAAIMLSIYLVARLLYRDRFSLNAVGLAAWLLLLYQPTGIFEPSFQLTFLSMVALSGIVQPLLEGSSQPYKQALRGLELAGIDLTLTPALVQFRLDLRLLAKKTSVVMNAPEEAISWAISRSLSAALGLYELVIVSVVMQLALAVPMTVYFHRLALLGVPANILVVPLTAVLMPATLIAMLVQLVSSKLALVAWGISALCLHGITFIVQGVAGIGFSEVRLAVPETWWAMMAATLFGSAVLCARRKPWGARVALGSLLIGALLVMWAPHPRLVPGSMEVTTIDVGQGDSILLVSPDGKTLLVDGGGPAGPFRTDNFDIGEDVVSPYLWSRGITRLTAVAVTHAHSDHLSGLPAIIANFRPEELWLGTESQAKGYEPVVEAARQYGTTVKRYSTGDQIAFGTARLAVLNPPKGFVAATHRNEDSLVMQAFYGQTSALLTGDAERKTEGEIAGIAEKASLLKVAHHGSGSSTTPELLKKTQPGFAVISAGYRNLYGHPRADVLARLRAAQVRTYRTDISGAVTFYLDGQQVTVSLPNRR